MPLGGGDLEAVYGFTEPKKDAYINLIHMGARWYNASIGRWISPDSIIPEAGNPQALNRFSYVLGNPLKYTDPSGHSVIESEEDGPRTLQFEIEAHILLATDMPGCDNQNTYNLLIYRAARKAGISPMFVKAVVAAETEGTFDPSMRNRKSRAVGLMQLLADTAGGKGLRVDDDLGFRVDDDLDERYDPFKNLVAGASFLADQYYDEHGYTGASVATGEDRWKLAATAYTAGPGTVQKARGIIQTAPTDSPWYGRNPYTYGGLTRPDATTNPTNQSPLSVAAESELRYSTNYARTYVNSTVAGYIRNIGNWLKGMRP